jgi:hypothetical protein
MYLNQKMFDILLACPVIRANPIHLPKQTTPEKNCDECTQVTQARFHKLNSSLMMCFPCVFSDRVVAEPAAAVRKGQMHHRVHPQAKRLDRQSDSKSDNTLSLPQPQTFNPDPRRKPLSERFPHTSRYINSQTLCPVRQPAGRARRECCIKHFLQALLARLFCFFCMLETERSYFVMRYFN